MHVAAAAVVITKAETVLVLLVSPATIAVSNNVKATVSATAFAIQLLLLAFAMR